MTELQAKFHKDLVMHGYTESNIQIYLLIAGEFERFVGLSPEIFEEKHAVNFLYDCITNRKLKEDTVNFKNSIIKLLFVVTLNKEWNDVKVSRMKKRKTLPVVLSKNEVKEFFDSIDYLRYKTIFSVIYSGGLRLSEAPKLKEKLNLLNETLEDDIEHLQISSGADAKIGHKTVDSSFLGYKTHIAMSGERIITAATITTGEKNDGKELKALVNKTMEAGVKIDTIIGDAAYSEKGNIELANENDIKLVSKLNHSVTQGYRKKGDEFQFNKCWNVRMQSWPYGL